MFAPLEVEEKEMARRRLPKGGIKPTPRLACWDTYQTSRLEHLSRQISDLTVSLYFYL